MNLPVHTVSDADLDALARGQGTQALPGLIRARHSRLLLLLRAQVEHAPATTAAGRSIRSALTVLSAAEKRAPQVVRQVLTYPSTARRLALAGAHLARPAAAAGATGEEGDMLDLTAVAAVAAIRSGLRLDLDLAAPGGLLVLPSLGTVRRPATDRADDDRSGDDRVVLRIDSSGTELVTATGALPIPVGAPGEDEQVPWWQPLPRISVHHRAHALAITVDPEPVTSPPSGLPGRRPERAELQQVWAPLLRRAWELLVTHQPRTAAQVAAAISVICPLVDPPHGWSSASLSEAFGCVAMSTPPDPEQLAEALVHELHHTKLALLNDLRPLVRPDDGRRFYAPWREDPRPASGLLHGVYAHLAVADFARRRAGREQDPRARRQALIRFEECRSGAAAGAARLLDNGVLTSDGIRFTQGVAAAVAHLGDPELPTEITAAVRQQGDRHRERWLSQHAATAVL